MRYRKRYICKLKSFWRWKKGVWGKGNISTLPFLVNFFQKRVALFVTLKKITLSYFQSNLNRKCRKCEVRKTLLFSHFPYSDHKPIFSLHFSAFCFSIISVHFVFSLPSPSKQLCCKRRIWALLFYLLLLLQNFFFNITSRVFSTQNNQIKLFSLPC